MNILIILLGCHISLLLNDRVNTAVKHMFNLSRKINKPITVSWYLSGGIKNPSESTISEADKMREEIALTLSNIYNCSTTNSVDVSIIQNDNIETKCLINSIFILDKIATNTAENFIIANNHIKQNNNEYEDIYVVTSNWHKKRAKDISDLSVPNNNFKWILGNEEYGNFKQMEHIHMHNIHSDVNNALNKFKKN